MCQVISVIVFFCSIASSCLEKFVSHCFVKLSISLYDNDSGHEQKKEYGSVGY